MGNQPRDGGSDPLSNPVGMRMIKQIVADLEAQLAATTGAERKAIQDQLTVAMVELELSELALLGGCSNSKLTPQQKADVVEMRHGGMKLSEIASYFAR